METIFGSLMGVIVAIAFLFIGLFWPILLMYSVWRLLRAVERIAAATERTARADITTARVAESTAPLSVAQRDGGISMSAFGR